MRKVSQRYRKLAQTVLLANVFSLFLLAVRLLATKNGDYSFMAWNLFLAWLPVAICLLMLEQLRTHSWREPRVVFLTIAWLFFLPNSFYMITDFIHLRQTGDIGIQFDAVLLLSFVLNGLLAGFWSLLLIHNALLKRRPADEAHGMIALVLVVVSFAIYLGRTLRWNSWDVLAHPGGLLYDVSERVINPFSYPQALTSTALFFLLLGSIYLVVRQFAALNHR